jgi:SAM-dependent methyltransferase
VTTERAIERNFPIVQLNALALKEKPPVYQMHKWFARRSSSVFRAILLGAALPAEESGKPLDLMAEFYRGHGDDPRLRRPDGSPLRVLDPFMGGGTTVVEALRLGFDVTGGDYNPIAWLIVKGETTPVNAEVLEAAFQRVSNRVREDLLGLFKTRCPLTGKDADILYGFWVKQGVCVAPSCNGVTDLFKSYEVARKRGDASLKYLPVTCPHCDQAFDWELERCTVTAGGPQVSGGKAAGKGRPVETRWAFGRPEDGVDCPHCRVHLDRAALGAKRPATKSVPLHVLLDPTTGDLFEVRGDLPEEVVAPTSGHRFDPEGGAVDGGKFSCQRCGQKQDIVTAARTHGKPLPFRYYGFYAHTPHAGGLPEKAERMGLPTNNQKWFGAVTDKDLARVSAAASELSALGPDLPLPHQEIHDGYNTNRLVIHQYRRWSDLFGARQLLALGKLLKAITEEPHAGARDALLAAFQSTLNYQSWLCRYNIQRNQIEGVQSGHDYRNPTTIAESSTFGAEVGLGRGTFVNYVQTVKEGLAYLQRPDLVSPQLESVLVDDVKGDRWRPNLRRHSATELAGIQSRSIDLLITDPPYAGSVQYAEMSDWSYVWLHHVLKDVYPDEFGAEITLKSQEVIEDNDSKDARFFFDNLAQAWREAHRVLVDDGLLAFTFHHKEGDRWTGLLRSLFEAGFYLVAAYPTHSEPLHSIVIQATGGITYDIVHVCRKRLGETEPIPWSLLRREVTRQARAQLKELEQGTDVLPGPDVQMILLGKALMLFSRHYGKVLDADGQPMDLDEAMERILVLVREVRGEELPLPGTLQDLDSLTQLALLHVVGKGPWTRDDLHKELRGYTHGPDALVAAGLVREVAGRKGHLEVVPPGERVSAGDASDRQDGPMIDKLHLLLSLVQAGRSLEPLAKRWRGQWGVLGEALAWLAKADPSIRDLAGLTIRQLEALGPDTGPSAHQEQLGLFGKGS